MTERKFEITNASNEKLVCIEVLPTKEPNSPLPAVILCHGFAYFKEEDGIFTSLAKRLAAKGYAVYYFDFSGCGESEGNYTNTSLTKLTRDLRRVHEEITGLSYIDGDSISLVGQSFGTSVVIAAQILNVVRVVLCGAFVDPYVLLSGLFDVGDFNEHGISTRGRSDGRVTTIGPQFWQDLKSYQLENLIEKFDCPILFVHGKLDNIVPMSNMWPLLQAAKHPHGPIVLEKSDHGLRPEREQAYRAIEAFFE